MSSGASQAAGLVSGLEALQTTLRVGALVNGVGLVNDAIDLSLDGTEYGSSLLDDYGGDRPQRLDSTRSALGRDPGTR